MGEEEAEKKEHSTITTSVTQNVVHCNRVAHQTTA